MTPQYRSALRLLARFRRRWTVALLSVAALALGTAFLNGATVRANADNAEQVNVSGRQRMLSQRISLASGAAMLDATNLAAAQQLSDALSLMRESHARLTDPDIEASLATDMGPAHERLYFGETALDERVVAYLDSAQAIDDWIAEGRPQEGQDEAFAALTYVIDEAVGSLLPALDSAVVAYQAEGEARISDALSLQLILAGVSIGVLALIGFWVFRPMESTIRSTFDDVQDRERQLQHTQQLHRVGLLATTIAHDLKNLSGVATGNLQLLREDLEEDGSHPLELEEALDALRDLDSTSRRLLELGRGGDEDALPEALDLTAHLRGMSGLLVGAGRPALVSFDLPEDPLPVRLVRRELESALLNLVGNAGEAMSDRGEGRVTVVVGLQGDEVLLRVADDGPGIPEDLRDTIFEPFVSGRLGDGGTGLGLHQVRRFASRSGGSVEFETGPGGTTFSLRLPCTPSGD